MAVDRSAAFVPLATPDERVPGRGFIVMCSRCRRLARSGLGTKLPTCCGRVETTTRNWRAYLRRKEASK